MLNEPKKTGRPPIYTDPDELYAAGESYIRARMLEQRPPTVTGLALALGLSGRKVLDDYERREAFSYPIKKLKSKCEDYYEECLTNGQPAAGAIFALKNFGWRDKAEIEHSGNINVSLAAQIESARRRATKTHDNES